MIPNNKELEKKNLNLSFNKHDNTPLSKQKNIFEFLRNVKQDLLNAGFEEEKIKIVEETILRHSTKLQESLVINSPIDEIEIDDSTLASIQRTHDKLKKINLHELIQKIETDKPFVDSTMNEIVVDVLNIFKDYISLATLSKDVIKEIYDKIYNVAKGEIGNVMTIIENLLNLLEDEAKYNIQIILDEDVFKKGLQPITIKNTTVLKGLSPSQVKVLPLSSNNLKTLPLKCYLDVFSDSNDNIYIKKFVTTLDNKTIHISHKIMPELYKTSSKSQETLADILSTFANLKFGRFNRNKKLINELLDIAAGNNKPAPSFVPEISVINIMIPFILDTLRIELEESMKRRVDDKDVSIVLI